MCFLSLMLAAEKHKATFMAPLGIGLTLFIAELMGVYYTGGSLNPVSPFTNLNLLVLMKLYQARSFGPAVVLGSFESYHWIYWLGPCMGATVAAGFYKFIKVCPFLCLLSSFIYISTVLGV
jgi:aquaporin related protein